MTATTRRQFLTGCGALGAVATTAKPAQAGVANVADEDAVAMLYDTTLCIGCKACVTACTKANGLEPDTADTEGRWQVPEDLNPQTKNIIKLYRDDENDVHSFFKHQCMHCREPACVTGCPFHALKKDEQGIVRWDGSRCIGCRYCEVACPYRVPKFEWKKFNPKIVKCEFCAHRLAKGQEPACTEVCPCGAVIFGNRKELLEEAHARLERQPGKYHEKRVYGEVEGGGTQVLYLSHVPFEKLDLPVLGTRSLPSYATKWMSIFTKYMAIPAALYATFTCFVMRNWKEHDREALEVEDSGGLRDQI